MQIIAAIVLAGIVALAQASLLQRPTTVSAVLLNSPKLYDGSYAGTGVARMCGEVDPSQSFASAPSFLVEYPLDVSNAATVTDVRFSSKALVASNPARQGAWLRSTQTANWLRNSARNARVGSSMRRPPLSNRSRARPTKTCG